MHSILVTFQTSASPEELAGHASDVAQAMLGVEGLISKTWIADGDRIGAFYVFTDRAAVDAYLAGEIIAGVRGNPAFSDVDVRHFDVMEELSVLNGTPATALANR